MKLFELAPDRALAAFLNGQVKLQDSETEAVSVIVYAGNERPNVDLSDEFIEVYINGLIQSITKPYNYFKGAVAVAIYSKLNSDGSVTQSRISNMVQQLESLINSKRSYEDYVFEFNPDNIITTTTPNISTGYATTILNIVWHTRH